MTYCSIHSLHRRLARDLICRGPAHGRAGFLVSLESLSMPRVFAGTNTSPTLTEAQILALSDYNAIESYFPGTYPISSATPTFYYFAYADSMGNATNFVDGNTGFPISMAEATDNAAYSNVAAGWSYDIVSVTTDSVTANYRVYRTQYEFSATPLRMVVSGPGAPGGGPTPPSVVGSALMGDTMGGFW